MTNGKNEGKKESKITITKPNGSVKAGDYVPVEGYVEPKDAVVIVEGVDCKPTDGSGLKSKPDPGKANPEDGKFGVGIRFPEDTKPGVYSIKVSVESTGASTITSVTVRE